MSLTANRFLLQHRRHAADPWRTLVTCGRRDLLARLMARTVLPGELRIHRRPSGRG